MAKTVKGKFYVPIYDCHVFITIADDPVNSLNYYLRKNDDGEIDYKIEGYCYKPNTGVGKYYLFFSWDSLSNDTFNHEKSHLVENILENRNIKPRDEVRSYLDGYISTRMYKFLNDRKIKLK
jgi:hypothetical protein